MKITSRNVNGIRAVVQKGFFERLKQDDPDILCLQETKAFETQVPPELSFWMNGYTRIWHAGQTPGYAGVAVFVKKEHTILSKKSHFEAITHFHEDGRVIEVKLPQFTLLNIYFPNGGEKADGTEMLSYKLKFYEHLLTYIEALKAQGEKIIVCGDFNICHREIDIARPNENRNSIGFLPIERAELDRLSTHGYIDAFRYFYPGLDQQYTWWNYRAGARPRNVGRRLDYFWVSENLIPALVDVKHQTQVMGSDHCPVSLIIRTV